MLGSIQVLGNFEVLGKNWTPVFQSNFFVELLEISGTLTPLVVTDTKMNICTKVL